MTDLEELKRLLAEATPENWELVWHGNESYPFPLSILADNGTRWIARDGTVSSPAIALLLFKAAHALPDLIARVERAEKERDRFREELRYACAFLISAARSYRVHAGRSGHIRPRSRPDPFFLTRVSDMDKAAEQARAALTGDTPNV